MNKGIRALCLCTTLAATMLTGCARKPDVANNDPFENYNRIMYAFNQDIDHLALRPVAKVYETVVPTPLRKGVTNAFDNLGELTTLPNDILQGNFGYVPLDIFRFLINSTVGIGGLFDVATRMGIPKHVETFGLTFAKWRGGKTSPYFVLPFLGPSTVQNAFGTAAATGTQPWVYMDSEQNAIRYSAIGLNIVNTRARFLDADKLVETAFDPYVFVRDAYMQRDKRAIEKNQRLGTPNGSFSTRNVLQGHEAVNSEHGNEVTKTTKKDKKAIKKT